MLLRIHLNIRLLHENDHTLLAFIASAYDVEGTWLDTFHKSLNKPAAAESRLEELRDTTMEKWVAVMSYKFKHVYPCRSVV